MKISKLLILSGLLSLPMFAASAQAKLRVVTTIPDLKVMVEEIGGDHVAVDSIAKGTQDPHFIEAKPSYMVKAAHADLFVAVGLDLEIGWVPSIINGARNPKIAMGSRGYLEVGSTVQPLEVPSGKISRAEGDVHPLGNPHVNLDPIRMGEIAVAVAQRMGELDSSNAADYLKHAQAFKTRLAEKTKGWQARINATGIKKVVSYHKTLTYFFDRFKLQNPAILEPKPGIPPTSGHIIDVIQTIKEQGIRLILVENYFDATVTNKIKPEVPSIRAVSIPVLVDGAPGIKTSDDLYEAIVRAIEGK